MRFLRPKAEFMRNRKLFMKVSAKIKQKIVDGTLREMWQEAKWMYKYIRRYRFVVFVHIALGVVATLMSLLSSVGMRRMIDVVTGFWYGGFVNAAVFKPLNRLTGLT